MKAADPNPIHLKDYRPPSYRIAEIALDFDLDPEATRVTATMNVVRVGHLPAPLMLDGQNLKLLSLKQDGVVVEASAYTLNAGELILHAPPASFTLEIVTEIAPAKNTALEGLYMSNGIYCTQCEPEGFRAITFFLDRPDNLARYRTRIEAAKQSHPVLLSNGNLVEAGELEGGRHFSCWEDPFPKPSYLFALVAGDLGSIRDTYRTASQRNVDLRIYVEHGNEAKATYAMDSLKRAMRWDEEVYGREYDLDIFMIVAVSVFNFGAMENKGLNIFNDKVLLASSDTATDDDYARIESVVAHEYFHNWTGDRITCRDWFQLSLKEGLTVFRESGFAGDMRSRAVRRISDVQNLRLRQFQEDAGPLAHPVQPQSYIAIDNFYTATIYEKGAEIIGMLKTVIGAENFRSAMDLYFTRHDGESATVEDFVRCFEDATGRNLDQFRLWYAQAGTPQLAAGGHYDPQKRTYRLRLTQSLAPTPGQDEKKPMLIPVAMGLIGKVGGDPLPLTLEGENAEGPHERVLELKSRSEEFVFTGLLEEPVLSLGRGFSAPVQIQDDTDRAGRAFLIGHDTDPFNRWDAGQKLATEILLEMVVEIQAGRKAKVDLVYLEAVGKLLARAEQDPALTAQILAPPSENELAMAMSRIDPEAIHLARRELIVQLWEANSAALNELYTSQQLGGPFSPDAQSAGRRALRNIALRYVTSSDDNDAAKIAHEHYQSATNMTDMIAGLAALSRIGGPSGQEALDHFFQRFESDPLVLDKWLSLQATASQPGTVERVRALMVHQAFSLKNPNRVRALVGAFANANPLRFHDSSGSGYRLVREVAQTLDVINPQTAARMMTAFETWRRYDPHRQGLIRAALETILNQEPISPNLYEIVAKILGGKDNGDPRPMTESGRDS